jgi:hypothetical protein
LSPDVSASGVGPPARSTPSTTRAPPGSSYTPAATTAPATWTTTLDGALDVVTPVVAGGGAGVDA